MKKESRIYKLSSKLSGLYVALFRDTMPFHNQNMTCQENGLKLVEAIKKEINDYYEKQ